jgi:hypothetical protein
VENTAKHTEKDVENIDIPKEDVGNIVMPTEEDVENTASPT